jgi:hypothetical protein
MFRTFPAISFIGSATAPIHQAGPEPSMGQGRHGGLPHFLRYALSALRYTLKGASLDRTKTYLTSTGHRSRSGSSYQRGWD